MSLGQQGVWANVLNFTVQDYATKEVIFRVNYATDVSVGLEYEENEIRGGSDNEIQMTLYHTPTSSFNATLPLLDDNVMIAKTGAVKTIGAQISSYDDVLPIDATTGVANLQVTPEVGTLKIQVIDDDGNLGTVQTEGTPASNVNEYTLATNTLTFHDDLKGKKVFVICDYTTTADAVGLTYVIGTLPKLIRITATAKQIDKGGRKAIKKIIIDKALSNPSFTKETSAGNTMSIPFECKVFGFLDETGKNRFFKEVLDETIN